MSLVADNDSFWRIVLCHKHPFSARLRFLIPQDAELGVLMPTPLPPLSVIADEGQDAAVLTHPATALAALKQQLGLDSEFEVFSEFRLRVEVPEGLMPVYLVTLTSHDICPAPEGMYWIDMMDTRRGNSALNGKIWWRWKTELVGKVGVINKTCFCIA